MTTAKAPDRRRAGFTLMEMMIVVMIIGLLSTYLVVNAPAWMDRARMTASEQNMKRLYTFLLDYQQHHNGSFPRDDGQRFFIRPWKDGMIEKTESQANAFFSPAYPFEDCAADMGYEPGEITIVEYLDDWDAIGPGYTSYAGFDAGGDREVRMRLKRNPGSTAIVSDAQKWHRTAVIYLTGDGATHRLLSTEIEELTGLDLDEEVFMVGPGCGVEILETVSNT